MTPVPEMRDLAQWLLARESNAGDASAKAGSATMRVYEKLRQSLGELAGVAGFRSLASRALTLARTEVPGLNAMQVEADGNLKAMSAIDPAINTDEDPVHDGGVILISRLLGLLLLFFGEALTMNLVRDVWPDADLDDCNSENGRKA
jgi:hypothetical protein